MSESAEMDYKARRERFAVSGYRTEIVDEILERLANGEAVTAICAESDMPSCASLFRWIAADAQLGEAYARARESCGHVHASRALYEAMNATDAAIGRLRADTLKWAASKYAPKNYGDNLQVRHADADGEKLNTQPLVSELLSMMGPGASIQAPTMLDVTPRDITPTDARKAAQLQRIAERKLTNAYRPRGPMAARTADSDDASDLV